jgi:hypothetical protein
VCEQPVVKTVTLEMGWCWGLTHCFPDMTLVSRVSQCEGGVVSESLSRNLR